ncbi:MAG: hypothetical protein QXG70_03570 [Candidatus Methanomethylicaceae archaeon]
MKNYGISLTISSFIIMLILISIALTLSSVNNIFLIEITKDPRLKIQIKESLIKNLIIAKIKGIDIKEYIQNISFEEIPNIDLIKIDIHLPSGIIKIIEGNGTFPFKIKVYAPNGTIIAILDKFFILKTIETISNNFIELTIPNSIIPSSCLIVYSNSPSYTYSGIINYSFYYKIIQNPPSIIAKSWSPPYGINQIFIYGAPQLSLIQIFNSSIKLQAIMDPYSKFIAINGPSMNGTINVIIPLCWYYGDIKSGDVYVFNP